MLSMVNGTLTGDFIAQSTAAASDEDDLAIQVGDGFGGKVASVELVDNPFIAGRG